MWAAHGWRGACRGQGLWMVESGARGAGGVQAQTLPPGPSQATCPPEPPCWVSWPVPTSRHRVGPRQAGSAIPGQRRAGNASCHACSHPAQPGGGCGAPAGIWGRVCCFGPSASSGNSSTQRGQSPSPHWAHERPSDSRTGRGHVQERPLILGSLGLLQWVDAGWPSLEGISSLLQAGAGLGKHQKEHTIFYEF